MRTCCLIALLVIGLLGHSIIAQDTATETRQAQQDIIKAGQDSKVQEHLHYLCNRIGPRLTSSEGCQAACEWARDEFEKMGLKAKVVKWGEFPVGFERGPAFGSLVEPKQMKLEFGTNAWTAGTKGRILGKVLNAPQSMEQLEKMRDDLKGNYVLTVRTSRFRSRRSPEAEEKKEGDKPEISEEEKQQVRDELQKAGLAGMIYSTRDERILTGGSYRITNEELPTTPMINLLKTQFDEIKTMVDDGKDVQVAFDIRNHFRKGPIPLYNVIADIPGTEKPDECVVVGGHIDSWDGATGATDNASGCATTIEAARILMAAGVKPKRTIRFMLWSGEEQGLLGSRAWVEQNPKEVQNTSAVFVHDGGTNYVAGIRCTTSQKKDFEEIFAEAMQLDERTPFEISVTETMRPRGGSDHVSFIRAGVPGYFWMQQGRAVYRTTHHTQYDTYDSVVPEYQKHSSIVIALGAYGTANLDHLISRDGIQN